MNSEYAARINRVMDYIDGHIDENLNLAELADVANFSRFHFHRVFAAATGETLFQFIQRLRLERAAAMLVMTADKPVTHIALDCGFSNHAAFTRSFRARYGVSPSQWRAGKGRESNPGTMQSKSDQNEGKPGKAPEASSVYVSYDSNVQTWRYEMKTTNEKRTVTVKDLPEIQLAYLRHVGPYQGNSKLFEELFGRLYRWAGPRGLIKQGETESIIIYHDNPDLTDEDKLRVSVCITVPKGTPVSGEVGSLSIPAGKYALARFEIGTDGFAEAWGWTYGTWLPDSGYACDDRPTFEWYHEDAEKAKVGRFIVDIVVPVKPL